MYQVLKMLTVMSCLGVIFSFPVPWKSLSVPLAFEEIASSVSVVEQDGNLYGYLVVLSNFKLSLNVLSFNCSLDPPAQLAMKNIVFGSNISSPTIISLGTTLLLTYNINAAAENQYLLKTDLSVQFTEATLRREVGLYMKEYGYLMSIREELRVLDQPDLNGGILSGDWSSSSAYLSKIKFLVSRNLNKHLTCYYDKNYFYVRTLYSDPDTFAAQFHTYDKIFTPRVGYFCACLNNDETVFYFQDTSNYLMSYNLTSSTLATIALVSFTPDSLKDCYYDQISNSIVYAQGNLVLHKYSLDQLAIIETYPSSYEGFHVDETRKYVMMYQGGTVYLNKIQLAACSPGSFYDFDVDNCQACPVGCTLCQDYTNCTQCESGYSLDNNTCVHISVNASGEKTILEELLISLLQNDGITFVNRIPGGRKALPFLSFLINIDELWLYQYHERDYGELMNALFQSVQKLENQKWRLLEDQTTEVLYAKVGTSKDAIYGFIDTKLNYTSPRFREVEDRGETFLPACWEFITFNLFFALLGFLLLRWGARILRRWKIAQCLRPFRTVAYLTPLLLDGNLQYFFFLLFSQVRLGFSLSPRDKMLNVLNYLLYFLALWASVVSCFLAFWTTRKLCQYLLDNWRTRVRGLLAHSLSGIVRTLVLGAVHSLLRDSPLQLPVLLGVEAFYVALLLFFMGYWRAHRVVFRVCFTVCFALLRIVLQGVLILQQRGGVVGTGSEVERTIQGILGFILVAYFFLIYCGTGWSLTFEVIEIIRSKEQASGKEKQSNQKDKKVKKGKEEKGEPRPEEKSQEKDKKMSQGKKKAIDKQASQPRGQSKAKSQKKPQKVRDAAGEKEEKANTGKGKNKSCSGSKKPPQKSKSKPKEVKKVANVNELCREIKQNEVQEAEMKVCLNKKEDRFLVIKYTKGEKEEQ